MHAAPSLLTALAFLSFRGMVSAQAIYVDDSAVGANDGSSWQDAFTDLQSALAIAGTGNVVWVAQGTYRPSASLDRFATFNVLGPVYGGFAGTETDISQRAGLFDETILTGDLLGDDGPGFSNYADNSEHVVVFPAISSATLDGFTVRGGNANSHPDARGGGLLVDFLVWPEIVRNCTFVANFARGRGGAIAIYTTESVTIERCTFLGNRSRGFGGGVAGSGNSVVVRSSRFLGNVSDESGGGLWAVDRADDCVFSGNRARRFGGGVWGIDTLFNCTFSGNFAGVGGGSFGWPPWVPQELFNCVLWGNEDQSGSTQSGQLAGTFAASNCIVEGWDATSGGAGTYDADPLFRSPLGADGIAGTLDDDSSVEAGSPCIDNGIPTGYAGLGVDVHGRPRFVNSLTCDGGGSLDRGAFERQQVDVSTEFCSSTPTSLGVPAVISGQCHVTEATLLFATPVPISGGNAFLLIGQPGSPQPFGDGFLCLQGPLRRVPAVDSFGNSLTFLFDPRSPPWSEVLPYGGTIGIQALFRDVAAGGTGFNLSSAMRLLAVP